MFGRAHDLESAKIGAPSQLWLRVTDGRAACVRAWVLAEQHKTMCFARHSSSNNKKRGLN